MVGEAEEAGVDSTEYCVRVQCLEVSPPLDKEIWAEAPEEGL